MERRAASAGLFWGCQFVTLTILSQNAQLKLASYRAKSIERLAAARGAAHGARFTVSLARHVSPAVPNRTVPTGNQETN